MSAPYFDRLSTLKRLIGEGPGIDFAKTVRPLLLEPASIEYFYDTIADPAWIPVLGKAGEFAGVPELQIDGDIRRFPLWPQSQFLARIAPDCSLDHLNEIMRVVLSIDATENPSVHADFTKAACAAARDWPRLVATWAERECEWVERHELLQPALAEEYGTLAVELAAVDQHDTALCLLRSLLALRDGKRPSGATEEDQPARWPRIPQARLSAWDYERILQESMPTLATNVGIPALEILCELLAEAIRLSRPAEEKSNPDDFSYIWRETIEEGSSPGTDMRDALVSSVRDVSGQLMRESGEDVLVLLEAQKPKVFLRIALYLRMKWPKAHLEGLRGLFASSSMVHDVHLFHELCRFLERGFGELPDDVRNSYFAAVSAGPDLNPDYEWREGEKERFVRKWRYRLLRPVRQHLPHGTRAEYEDLSKEFTTLERPDRLVWSEGAQSISPTSTLVLSDLEAKSHEDRIRTLQDFSPTPTTSDRLFGPTEGEDLVLADFAKQHPEKISEYPEDYSGLDPHWVAAVLRGVGDRLRQNDSLKPDVWDGLVKLLELSVVVPPAAGAPDHDHENTCRAAADIVAKAVDTDALGLPFRLRTRVFELICKLVNLPEPERDQHPHDPVTTAINATRGKALEAIINYAAWVFRTVRDGSGKNMVPDELNAAKEELERHLDPATEPSIAIHSLYGLHFTRLVAMMPAWAEKIVPRVFPAEPRLTDRWRAAWDAYLMYSQPYANVFQLLEAQYLRAANGLHVRDDEQARGPRETTHNLVEHIICFYNWGRVALDHPIMTALYEKGPPDTLAGITSFIGRVLKNTPPGKSLPVAFGARVRALWEWRIETASRAASPREYAKEIAWFSWWFSAWNLDHEWLLAQLRKAIQVAGYLELSDIVLERLGDIASEYTKDVMGILQEVARARRLSPFRPMFYDTAVIVRILRIGLEAQGKAREEAETAMHLLGSSGMLSYGDHLGLIGEESS